MPYGPVESEHRSLVDIKLINTLGVYSTSTTWYCAEWFTSSIEWFTSTIEWNTTVNDTSVNCEMLPTTVVIMVQMPSVNVNVNKSTVNVNAITVDTPMRSVTSVYKFIQYAPVHAHCGSGHG